MSVARMEIQCTNRRTTGESVYRRRLLPRPNQKQSGSSSPTGKFQVARFYLVYSVCLVCLVKRTYQIDKIDQTDRTDHVKVQHQELWV